MIKTYNNFIVSKYESSWKLKGMYGSIQRYKKHYRIHYGLSDWLESLKGSSPSTQFVTRLARTLVVYGGHKVSDLPRVLSFLARQYRIKLPLVYGILTTEYWETKAKASNWVSE